MSRNNSTKRRSRLTSTSSFTSSSDSDNEIERRTFEKQKRRETKRTAKDLPTQDKPRANVGGLINNKIQPSTRGGGRRNSRDGVVSPSKKTLSNSQYVSPYQSNARNTQSPSQGKSISSKNPAIRQLPTVPFSTLQQSLSKDNDNREDKTEKSQDNDKTERNEDLIQSSSHLQVETAERSGSKLSDVSSLASSISSSASSSDENEDDNVKTKEIVPPQDQSEDQLEFSNKDTIKKVCLVCLTSLR